MVPKSIKLLTPQFCSSWYSTDEDNDIVFNTNGYIEALTLAITNFKAITNVKHDGTMTREQPETLVKPSDYEDGPFRHRAER